MRKNKYILYDFDFKFQYKTYKNIGEKHRIQFYASHNIFYRVYSWIRDKNNKEEKQYKNFDTFSQWKSYILEKSEDICYVNNDNLKHYLKKEMEYYSFWKNVWEVIITPIYVCLITIMITICSLEIIDTTLMIWTAAALILFISFVLIIKCRTHQSKYNFCKDYIEILEQGRK